MSKHQSFLRHALAGAAGLALLGAQGVGTAATSTICDPDGGYVVGYYNGSLTLPEDADAQRAALRLVRHGKNTTGVVEKQNNEPVRYEAFYSTSNTSASGSRLGTLASAYRAALDGALGSHWEFFWDFLGGDTSRWSALATASGDSRFSALTGAFPTEVQTVRAAAEADLGTVMASSSSMAPVQSARVQALYTERQKLTLVGHGTQGRLFADQGFAKIGSPTNSSALRMDLASRPGVTDALALDAKITALVTPTNLANNQGFFTATLSWSVPDAAIGADEDGTKWQNDFDLHVIEPTPPTTSTDYVQWVHFSTTGDPGKGGGGDVSKKGYAGYLDKDSRGLAKTDIGPEHYYATCDENRLLEGTYWVSVTSVRARLPAQTSVTLQIATAKSGEVYSKTFTDLTVNPVPEFIQQTRLSFPVKIELKKNTDGTWAKPVVTPYTPLATYESTGLPSWAL